MDNLKNIVSKNIVSKSIIPQNRIPKSIIPQNIIFHLSSITSKLQVVIYQSMVLPQVWSSQSQMIEYLLMFPLSTIMTALKIGISVSGFPK